MTRSADQDEEIWGSREELLLASAVGRHGPQNWQSVAMEVQKRSPLAALLTPLSCEKRFHVLQRRFPGGNNRIDGRKSPDGAQSDVICLLEELRKIRVAELRREVERYDVSILSLQLKVKELKEDRERTISFEENPEDGKGKENGDVGRSCNESNSSGRQPNRDADARPENGTSNGPTARHRLGEAPATDQAAGEESYDGSSDTIVKCTEAATPADEPAAKDSGDSIAESKDEEISKEGSDVQSSASPSRRRFRRRSGDVTGESSGGDDAETDEVSPSSKSIMDRSQPRSGFLESFRSSKLGSTFDQRLQSQETTEYRSVIRQHMDLAMVREKMAEGMYARDVDLYRDLLLLCANAVVFFPKDSPEHSAGVQLRDLVRKQIYVNVRTRSIASPEEVRLKEKPGSNVPTESDPEEPLKEKAGSDAQPLSSRKQNAKKEEEDEEEAKEEESEKKRTKERSGVVAVRRMRTGKGRGKASSDDSEPKNSGAANISAAKKKSAVNFLSRINRNGTLLESLKSAAKAKDKSSTKQAQEQSVPAKRGVGRPPKRPPPQSPPPPAKRSRASEAAASSKKRRRR